MTSSYALSWKPCQGDSLNLPDHRYQVYQGRLLASFQDDAKYEHVGQDTRSQVWKDKVELDGKIVKEEEETVKRIKGKALKEKDYPGAFIFPIRLEGQVNKNALADTGSDINTMPYRIYEQLRREDIKKGFLRTIGGIVNTPERLFSTFDGFCHQTFRAARSDVMRNAESESDDEEEYQIQRNKFGAPIYGPKLAPYLNCNDLVERSLAIQTVTNPFRKISVWKKVVSFLGSLPVPLKHVNRKPDYQGSYTKEEKATGQWRTEIRLTDPYGNVYLQGFRTKKMDRKLSKYHKLWEHTMMRPNHHDPNDLENMKQWKRYCSQVHHEFLLCEGCNRDAKSRYNTRLAQLLPRHIYSPCVVNWDVLNRMGCDGEIDDMLRIRLREDGSDEEIFTSVAWIRAFNINEPIY
ncbi:hypothetical protein Tco_0443193 [Tanacetum coccineum]